MSNIEELLRRREALLREIDKEILASHTRAVTLLFTDIIGSTRFYERMGDIAGRQMVQEHNDLLFPIVEKAGGRVVKTIGDAIMASFDDPAAAVRCAVQMQEAIRARNAAAGAAGSLRVRMGLHWGTAVADDKDLYGDAVNTAARVESLADGEEILISGQLAGKIGEAGITTVFLGSESVKGKEERIDIHLVNWQGRDEREIARAWRARQDAVSAPTGSGPSAADGPAQPIARPRGIQILDRPDPRTEQAALKPLPTRGNPYLNRVMVPHPGMFFGRAAIVRRLMSRLSCQPPQSVSIVGERRIGKSSLLNHLRSPVARLRHLESPDAFLFLLVDFQQLRASSPEQLFSLLFAEMRRQCANRVRIDLPADYDGMRMLCEAVAAEGMRMVFLFDEFEVVTKNSRIGPELYSFLRSLANNFPVSFITASGRDLKEMCASHEISDSPFFNIFSTQTVGLLSREEAETLVREPSSARGIPLAPLAESILLMGGRYPCFLQIAASAWFEHLENEGKPAEAFAEKPVPREVIDAFREEARPHFEFAFESFSLEEREVMRGCIAQGLADSRLPAAHELERKGYLAREGEELVPFSQEFLEFIRAALG
ncbi:MAG: adenylate/guanylate cyclase domain-containing protein [Spirochaetia bacterium]